MLQHVLQYCHHIRMYIHHHTAANAMVHSSAFIGMERNLAPCGCLPLDWQRYQPVQRYSKEACTPQANSTMYKSNIPHRTIPRRTILHLTIPHHTICHYAIRTTAHNTTAACILTVTAHRTTNHNSQVTTK